MQTSACVRKRLQICSDAVIQPVREPGAITLLKESARITRPSTSIERNDGTIEVKNSAYDDGGGTGDESCPV